MLHIPVCHIDWRGCHYNFSNYPQVQSPEIFILSDILVIGGLIIAIIARKELAGNWSGGVDFKKNHELIKTGIYKYIRHPIYTGILFMILGSALLIGIWEGIIVFSVSLLIFWVKLKDEEKMMTKHFPKEYMEYKKLVNALVPFIL
jgi:protein-S-isoprenylcysteine O-methyltransferase Ste14